MSKRHTGSAVSVLFAVGVLFSGMASANAYIGFNVGSGEFDVDLTSLGGGKFEKDSTATKFYAGYAFTKHFAAEGAIYNFAEASVGALETSPGSGNFVSGAVDMKGLGAFGVGMFPVNKHTSIIAKIGVLSWDADLRVNNSTASSNGTDLAYALSVSYAFTKTFMATLDWENYESDNPELQMIGLGFKFVFK